MAGAQAAANAATPAERDRVAPSYVRFGDEEELEDMATDGDELALRELAWRNAQTYTLEKAAEAERDARCLDLAMELKWNSADQDMGTKILTVLDDLRLVQLDLACHAPILRTGARQDGPCLAKKNLRKRWRTMARVGTLKSTSSSGVPAIGC